MITTKQELKEYLLCDKIAMNINKKYPSPFFFRDEIWKFEITYRKLEYFYNNKKKPFYWLAYVFYYFRFRNKCLKRCCEIDVNVIDKGLVIWHGFNITISGKAKIGKNFSVSSGCCIGQANEGCPVIGDNVEMGRGSMILGGIQIANDTTVGAGAIVVKDIFEEGTTVGGIPAKCISKKKNGYVQDKKNRLEKVPNYINL